MMNVIGFALTIPKVFIASEAAYVLDWLTKLIVVVVFVGQCLRLIHIYTFAFQQTDTDSTVLIFAETYSVGFGMSSSTGV